MIAALVDSHNSNEERAAQARTELQAWTAGEAPQVRDLRIPTPTLAVRLGAWVDEPCEVANDDGKVFERSGHGYAFGDSFATVASSTRGFWRIAAAKAESRCRVLGYRRGRLLLHGFAEHWSRDGDRFWADSFYYARDGRWVDADSGATYDLGAEDRQVDEYLSSLPAIIPNGDRNPVAWVGGDH